MKKIIIENCEILTPFGNLSETLKNLYAGKSAVVAGDFYDCPVSLAKIQKEMPPKEIVEYYRNRFDKLSDRLLSLSKQKTLFIYAVAKGDINKIIDENYNGYSPILEIQAKQVAQDFGLGDCEIMVSSNACAAGAAAIDTARLFLQDDKSEFERAIIFGFEQISEFVVKGFHALGAISPTGAKPFDKSRDGMSLGEGSGILVLRAVDDIPRRGITPAPPLYERGISIVETLQNDTITNQTNYSNRKFPFCKGVAGALSPDGVCYIAGSGSSNDANHRTAPSRDGAGLALSIERALKSAGIDASEISAIKCHGTATPYNDAMEAKALTKIFGENIPVMTSTKGALGHLSGAGSLIETIIAAGFLKEGVIPATIGFGEFDADNPPFVEEKISVSSENQKFDGKYILCLSCGFGGMNTAIILGKN